ncbi:MAG: CubicO group peptidase (beta-lactamase class C family) [Pirellulaceae bacterium]|jgi:CubicO group peptidase (beta-lactamase class C family)
MRYSLGFLVLLITTPAFGQLQFPDVEWKTVAPESVSWSKEKLHAALDFAFARNTSEVIILHRGRILAQRRQNITDKSFQYRGRIKGQDSRGQDIEDVASVQKSIVSFLVGVAQEKKLISIDDPVDEHLGEGWSKATPEQDSKIQVRHLITMTSGLNTRLQFVAPAGTQWKYNTTVYSRSLRVIEKAAGMTANELTKKWLTGPIGMKDSKWVKRPGGNLLSSIDANTVGFATTASDLARFGLLMLADGKWDGKVLLADKKYLKDSHSSSQPLNPSYGYLWWLNGKKATVRPIGGKTNKPLLPEAPADMYAAQGAMGRKCYVCPALQLVVVRLGDTPDSIGNVRFDKRFWTLIMNAAPKK